MSDIYYRQEEARVYDLEYAGRTQDIPFWVELAREYVGESGTALELGCGTLRITLPVAQSGVHVVGVDVSPWMLEKAKQKLDQQLPSVKERIGLLEVDVRTLQLEQKFNLIYFPFNSFLLMRTVQDQLAVFNVVRRHLAPGGVFAFDVFVPRVERLVQPPGPLPWALEVDETLGDLGVRFQRESARQVDPIQQRLFMTWRMKEYRDNVLEREWVSDLEMTYIFPRELEHLVARAGFEFVHYWGNYERGDFWTLHDPQVQLSVLRPK